MRQVSGKGVLKPSAPCLDGTFLLCRLAEDKAKEHVEAADDEEEESSNESEIVNVLGKNRSPDQPLEYAQRTETELRAQHGEEAIKECDRPANFRQNEGDDLKYDEEAIYDRPEKTTNLIWHGAVFNVFALDEESTCGVAALLGGLVVVHRLDVSDHDKDAAREDEEEGHDAEYTDHIETKEDVCTERRCHDEENYKD